MAAKPTHTWTMWRTDNILLIIGFSWRSLTVEFHILSLVYQDHSWKSMSLLFWLSFFLSLTCQKILVLLVFDHEIVLYRLVCGTATYLIQNVHTFVSVSITDNFMIRQSGTAIFSPCAIIIFYPYLLLLFPWHLLR